MINQDRLRKIVEEISFPRLTGTIHEQRALDLIKEKISNQDLEYSTQDFEFSTFYGRTYPRIGFTSIFLIFLMLYLNIETIFIPVFTLIIFAILIISYLFTRNPENIKLPIKLTSTNLFTKLSPIKNEINVKQDIFFICHLDTKGQKLSILARVRAMRTYVFSLLIIIGIIILKNYILPFLNLFFYIIGIFPVVACLVALVLLLLNETNNQSPGAIDNASGVACVFELLNYYKTPENRLHNFNLCFVFTGSEECGTMGIRFFYKKISNLDRNTTYFFNFDVIAQSVYMFPTTKSSNVRKLYANLVNNSVGLEIKTNPKKIYFGSHSDGYIMNKKEFNGIGIGDMDLYRYIHSVHDTPDKIDFSLLKNLCEIITSALSEFDKQTT